MSKEFSYTNLFQLFFSNYKLLFVVAIIAVVLSSVFSSPFFITPKYQSKSVLYPSNLISYSSETPTEQLLQLYESSEVWNSVIKKFNLFNHYKIDSSKVGAKTKLIKELRNNVTIRKTSYESVEITVLDKDPIIARDIVVEFTKQVNLKARRLQREKSKEVLAIYKSLVDEKKVQIDSIENSLKKISETYGVFEFGRQAEVVTEQYLESIRKGEGAKTEKIAELFNNFKEKGNEFSALSILLVNAYNEYNKQLVNYEKAKSDVTKELTYTNEIISPQISDKKSYPIRWIIVTISVLSSVFFAYLLMIVVKNLRNQIVE